MKIIKEGNSDWNKNPMTFKCLYCGCIFIACDSEYVMTDTYNNLVRYRCGCPCCGNDVNVYE